jgi:hypothetical protein
VQPKKGVISTAVAAGLRPQLMWWWSASTRGLLEQCWHRDPKARPTFDQVSASGRHPIKYQECP